MDSILCGDALDQSAGEVVDDVTALIERDIEVHGHSVTHAEQPGEPPRWCDPEIGDPDAVPNGAVTTDRYQIAQSHEVTSGAPID